jgi:hypothetical protein
MSFQNLTYVHAGGNADRIKHDIYRSPIRQNGICVLAINAYALVAVAPGDLSPETFLCATRPAPWLTPAESRRVLTGEATLITPPTMGYTQKCLDLAGFLRRRRSSFPAESSV